MVKSLNSGLFLENFDSFTIILLNQVQKTAQNQNKTWKMAAQRLCNHHWTAALSPKLQLFRQVRNLSIINESVVRYFQARARARTRAHKQICFTGSPVSLQL